MVSRLSALEEESIDYFVSFVQILGLPKSIGQIYGLFFVSSDPMAMDHVVGRLDISKGCASQGLATLKGFGAIIPVHMEGDRREHFEADFEVSKIVAHFFEETLEPRMAHGEERLNRMISISENGENPGENPIITRLNALKKWQTRGKETIPLIKEFLKA